MQQTKRVLVKIKGRVQGVGFRMSCLREARARGVTGWVRNSWDGSVEALLEGSPEAVNGMIGWCREGPQRAEVERVSVEDATPAAASADFEIRG